MFLPLSQLPAGNTQVCVAPICSAGRERPLVDSPRDFEKGLDGMHLGERGVSVCQLDGGDAQGPNVTAGVVGIVVLLLAGDDLRTNTQTEAATVEASCQFISKALL